MQVIGTKSTRSGAMSNSIEQLNNSFSQYPVKNTSDLSAAHSAFTFGNFIESKDCKNNNYRFSQPDCSVEPNSCMQYAINDNSSTNNGSYDTNNGSYDIENGSKEAFICGMKNSTGIIVSIIVIIIILGICIWLGKKMNNINYYGGNIKKLYI